MNPDGTEEALPVEPLAPMSAADIEAAAACDPDAPPLTEAELARLGRVPRVKTLRRALGLTQEEFAAAADQLAAEVRRHLADMLKRVRAGERFVVSAHGKAIAAVVPLTDVELVEAIEQFTATRPAHKRACGRGLVRGVR
jgi:prevent-host-death family protein